ncbi:hypothetical protein FS842_006834 [Serendipita sp. 407]|nr:hypothetical protein FS842_006834 [Serendipita sp. 407]
MISIAFLVVFLEIACLLLGGFAAPTGMIDTSGIDQPVILLPDSAVSAYKPFVYLAGAGYCPLSPASWSCGMYCNGVPDFQLSAQGGDGGANPYWYVGHSAELKTIVVGYQGTNSSNRLSVQHNVNFVRKTLPQDFFPGAPSSVTVHSGILDAHLLSATSVLNAVTGLLKSTGSSQVVLVGHSLGAALATLSGIHLQVWLRSNVRIKVIGFATPRIGNSAFADLADARLSDIYRVNNKRDYVPIIPGRFLGYTHTKGEIHISDESQWYFCPGRENSEANCTLSSVPNVLAG